MKSFSKKKVIVWAVDSTQDPTEAANIIQELKVWAKHLDCDVQPVSVYSMASFNFPEEMTFPWRDKLQNAAQKSLSQYLKKTKAKVFLPAKLLFTAAFSNRKMAVELANYAVDQQAQLIVANTRAMKTANPLRFGSFAETLVATSQVPVLLLNPSATPSLKITSILWPTDFSADSKQAFVRLKPWAKALKSAIIIYNQVQMPNIYFSEVNHAGQTEALELELAVVEKSRSKKGAEWMTLLDGSNIKGSLLVERQRKYLAADILTSAKKNGVSLIALANRNGPISQAILGSVARDILLNAKCPVLIFFQAKVTKKRISTVKQLGHIVRYDNRKGNHVQGY